jgi:hypothetical protein
MSPLVLVAWTFSSLLIGIIAGIVLIIQVASQVAKYVDKKIETENKTKLKVDTDKEHFVNVLKYGTDPLDLYNQYHIKSEEGNQLHLALMNFLHTDRGVSSNEALHISIFTCDMSPVKHHVSRLYDNDDLCLYCGRTKESDNYRSRNG